MSRVDPGLDAAVIADASRHLDDLSDNTRPRAEGAAVRAAVLEDLAASVAEDLPEIVVENQGNPHLILPGRAIPALEYFRLPMSTSKVHMFISGSTWTGRILP